MKLCPQCETGYADSHVTCPTHGVMLGEIRELRPGMLIRNTYRVVRKLGQGGMGAVYLCEHTLMDEHQALKFLSPELSQDKAFASRFLREVRTLRQVRHKNVVDAGNLEPAEDGTLFFSMEYVDGHNLRDFLDKSPKPFDVKLALEIVRGVAEGLGAAHAQGMVHRDIKPENILMARNGDGWTPKIADFGIVATKENSSIYTRTGGTLLTMAYAAPEQWRGVRAAELDGRTDLYALGGVLFELLTGRTAFEAESYEGWADQHRNAAPMPPSKLRPELANWQGLDALVLHLLAKDRERRPKDVAEAVDLLDEIRYVAPYTAPKAERVTELEKIGGAGRTLSEKAARRVPAWVWGAAGALLLAATFFAGRAYRSDQSNSQQNASVETNRQAQQQPEQPRPEPHTDPQPAGPKPAVTPTPARPEDTKPAGSTLLVLCDLACGWTMDGQAKGSIGAGGSAKADVGLGQHVVTAATADGADQVRRLVDIRTGGQTIESMELNPVREARLTAERQAREQVARDEEARMVWIDTATGLMWARKDNGSNVSWQQATDYCRNLQLAGHSGWHLATIEELQDIYDQNANVGGFHVKGDLQLSGWHWSGTPGDAYGYASTAWRLYFGSGRRYAAPIGDSTGLRALCVRRSGQ